MRRRITKDEERIALQVAKKAIREQPKTLAIKSFWRTVRRLADGHRYRDGFVEWLLVVSAIEEAMPELEDK